MCPSKTVYTGANGPFQYYLCVKYFLFQLIEETGLKVIAEDYEKCFAGECLTCSKERAAAASAASRVNQQAGGCVPMAPAIEVT